MAAMARLDERVTQLEMEMAEVRFLATKAEKEVTNVQMVLNGHTGTLNAIRHDQVDQVRELTRVKAEVNSLGAEMSAWPTHQRVREGVIRHSRGKSPAACLPARRPENTQSASDSPLT
jgi:septal ring factor EnvC (AmiA/AmiB activator)